MTISIAEMNKMRASLRRPPARYREGDIVKITIRGTNSLWVGYGKIVGAMGPDNYAAIEWDPQTSSIKGTTIDAVQSEDSDLDIQQIEATNFRDIS